MTVAESQLKDGSIVTAVVTKLDDLQMIEMLFHGLIMKRNGCEGNPTRLTDNGFVFPSLKDHVAKHGENGGSSEWYAVPGMYGGFNTRVAKDPECETWKLSCES